MPLEGVRMVRNILIWVFGVCWAVIITAVEAVGLDWGD